MTLIPRTANWCYSDNGVVRPKSLTTHTEGYETQEALDADHAAAVQAAQQIWIPVPC